MADSVVNQCGFSPSLSEAFSDEKMPLLVISSYSIQDGLRMLEKLSESYSLGLSESDCQRVLAHLYLMYKKNEVVNLTSIRSMPDGLILHAFDSLLFAKVIQEYLPLESSIHLLDMGTGGGFPGIPLACVSSFKVDLLDSVGKKIAACNEFSSELGISDRVHAYHARLEEFVKQTGRSFDCVTARALAKLDILLEYAEPYVKQGGYVFFGKANPEQDEIDDALKVATLCGFEFVSRETFELPLEMGHREIFVFKKARKSKVKLPRKNGEARNHPLSAR